MRLRLVPVHVAVLVRLCFSLKHSAILLRSWAILKQKDCSRRTSNLQVNLNGIAPLQCRLLWLTKRLLKTLLGKIYKLRWGFSSWVPVSR